MNKFAAERNPNVGEGAPAVLTTGAAPGDMLMIFLELVAESFGDADPLFRGPGVEGADKTKSDNKPAKG